MRDQLVKEKERVIYEGWETGVKENYGKGRGICEENGGGET